MYDGGRTDSVSSGGLGKMREYAVRRQNVGRFGAVRALLIALYVLVPTGLSLPVLFYGLYQLLLIVVLLEALLLRFTWPLTDVEYEYATDGLEITFSVIRGGSMRRDVLRLTSGRLAACAPLTTEAEALVRRADKVFDFRSGPDAVCPYFLRYQDGDRWVAVLFDGYRQMIEAIRFRALPVTALSPELPDYE